MLEDEICRAACKNTPPSEEWDIYDLILYHSVWLVYCMFKHSKDYTKQEAVKNKQDLIDVWKQRKGKDDYNAE